MSDTVERLAQIIDPEAFGLPDNMEPDTLTDRDIARDRARLILQRLRCASCGASGIWIQGKML